MQGPVKSDTISPESPFPLTGDFVTAGGVVEVWSRDSLARLVLGPVLGLVLGLGLLASFGTVGLRN
jgi:hypothetical protein